MICTNSILSGRCRSADRRFRGTFAGSGFAGGDRGAYYAASKDSTGAETQQHFDKLNREGVTKAKAFDGTFSTATTVFDAKGRKQSVMKPYGSTYGTTTFSFEAFNRVSQESAPAGMLVTYGYNGLEKSVTQTGQSGAQTTTNTVNARGETVKVVDARANQLLMQYDHFGNLEKKWAATGADGGAIAATTMTYNVRGQKIGMSDPDQGSWTYAYNSAGEMTSQTAPDSLTTTFAYDDLGRMTSRTENGNGGSVPGSYATTWEHETLAGSACGVMSAGKLCRTTGTGATRDFRYDKFSRPMSSKLTVTGKSTGWESFSAYDAMSRERESDYPATGLTL